MTLTRQVDYSEMEHIIDALGDYSERTKKGFLFFRGGGVRRTRTKRNTAASFAEVMADVATNTDAKGDDEIQSPFLPKLVLTVSHPGLKEFSAYVYRYWDSTGKKETHGYRSKYYIYLKVEPLMLVEGEQHIRLFELEGVDNKEALKEAFGNEVSNLFDMERCPGGITELDTWNTDRMDYTIDVKVDDKDEILIFKNLCKWSVRTNERNKSHYSARGDSFYDYGLLFGNQSWTLAVYDKYDQVQAEYNDVVPMVRERLLAEAENIMRIEVRNEKGKVQSVSQSLENGRNIMEFLNADVAKKLFQSTYGKEIGYQDFFRTYAAEKKLDEAFPMTRDEKKRDRDAAREAESQGLEYEHEVHSQKYMQHRAFLMHVLDKKGLKNVQKEMLNGIAKSDKKGRAAALARLRYELKTVIRGKVGISPVLIPQAWKYGKRQLNVPKEKLCNPLSDLNPKP